MVNGAHAILLPGLLSSLLPILLMGAGGGSSGR
jgi:hypothetical protein